MRKTTLALATLAMLTGTAHSTCYTLYAADGRMLSSSPMPPYSMAWPAEDPAAKASRARGDHLIISQGGCHAVPVEQPKAASAPKPASVRQVSRAAPASTLTPEQALEQKVRWFVSKGRSIDRENVPACMSQMRDLKPQVESLRASLDRMERSGDLFTLSEALASAQLCVTCTDSAMESCARADAALSRLRGTPMSVADAAANREIEQLRAQRPAKAAPDTPSLAEKDAMIGNVNNEQMAIMARLIQSRGYRCDSFSAATRSLWDGNFSVTCNNWKYKYSVEDRGGNWTVTLK